jgi:hypothetical protein
VPVSQIDVTAVSEGNTLLATELAKTIDELGIEDVAVFLTAEPARGDELWDRFTGFQFAFWPSEEALDAGALTPSFSSYVRHILMTRVEGQEYLNMRMRGSGS